MTTLTPNDASVLALLVQHPSASASKRRQLEKLLSEEGKEVAKALFPGTSKLKNTPQHVIETANALRRWAKGNTRMHAGSHRAAWGNIPSIVHLHIPSDEGVEFILGFTRTKRKKRSASARKATSKSRK